MEIASDQQGIIDHFIKTGAGLAYIEIHPQINCLKYRELFKVLRDLEPDKKPNPVALELPESKYSREISRDEWMAKSTAGVFKKNPK